jgi:hypothetical protein
MTIPDSFDQPYIFGRVQRIGGTGPFTTHEMARLQILRSKLSDQVLNSHLHPEVRQPIADDCADDSHQN